MKTAKLIPAAVIALLILITLSSGFYTVDVPRQVIITQFEKPVGDPVIDPGLHWKIPFIQKANYFERRWLEWDGDPNQIPTLDKKYIWVDTYARWRIADPLLFFQRVRNERGAQSRLDDTLDGATRIAIAKYPLIEVVRSTNRDFAMPAGMGKLEELQIQPKPIKHGRGKIMLEILEKSKEAAKEYGIELVDMRIKRINYIPNVRQRVYERMISERQRIAEKYRSEGRGESAKIMGDMQKELKRISSEAVRISEETKGKADAEATGIYAAAYNESPEFYGFWKTLETFKTTIDKDTWLVLTTKGDFYRYLTSASE